MHDSLQFDSTLPLPRFPFGAATPDVGTTATGAAVITAREEKTTKQGKPYTRLTIRNALGEETINVWSEQSEAILGLTVGTPVAVAMSRVSSHKGRLEWQFRGIEALPPNHAVAREALPVCAVPRATLIARTSRLLGALSAEARELFQRVMDSVVTTSNGVQTPLKELWVVAPAALGHHHAFLGGLWVHTLQVAEGAEALALAYIASGDAPDLDLDAVRLSALLHDLAKVVEYQWHGRIAMAPLSGSMNHMGWGLRLLTEALVRAELTDGWVATPRQRELAEHVAHVIASHHGRPEWGAIVAPASREAEIVHAADCASARVQPITDATAHVTDRGTGWMSIQEGWRSRVVFVSPTAPAQKHRGAAVVTQTETGSADLAA